MHMLSDYERPVSLGHFIECLTQIGDRATEKSIMKLEYKLKCLERLVLDKIQDARRASETKQETWLEQFRLSIETTSKMHDLLIDVKSSQDALVAAQSTLEPLNAMLDSRCASFEKVGKEIATELFDKQEAWLHEQAGERYLLDVRLASLEMKSGAAVDTMRIMKDNQELWLKQQSALVLEALKATPHKDIEEHLLGDHHSLLEVDSSRPREVSSSGHHDKSCDANSAVADFGRNVLSMFFAERVDTDSTNSAHDIHAEPHCVDVPIDPVELDICNELTSNLGN